MFELFSASMSYVHEDTPYHFIKATGFCACLGGTSVDGSDFLISEKIWAATKHGAEKPSPGTSRIELLFAETVEMENNG